MSILILDLPWK